MDLDGDGYISMYELEYFYEEQLQRMESLGIETLPFEDCLCQVIIHFLLFVPSFLCGIKILKILSLPFVIDVGYDPSGYSWQSVVERSETMPDDAHLLRHFFQP